MGSLEMASSVLYDAAIGESVNLLQIQSTNFQTGGQFLSDFLSGGLDPQALYFQGAAPQVQITTRDIAGVITNFDEQNGLHINSGSGTIKFPWNARALGGTFAGSGSHYQVTASRGLFCPVSYSANQSDPIATCEVMGRLYSTDGMTSPVGSVANASLGSQSYGAAYRLAPFFIGSTQLTGVVGVTINTGISVIVEDVDGNLYPTRVHIDRRQPTMTVRFRDAHQLATYGPLFYGASSCLAYFRKMSPGGSVVDDSTSEHCSFAFADCLIDPTGISGSGNASVEPSITIYGEALTVATGVPIDLTP